MSGLSISINRIVTPVSNFACGTCSKIKAGTLYVGEGLSNMAYDVYDLKNEGFEKWVKATISTLRMYAIFSGMTDRFNIAISTFESQKDLYYATKFIGSVTHFIRERPAPGESRLKCPSVNEGLYAIANFLDTAKFLKKNEVFEMKWASDVASWLGPYSLYSIPKIGEQVGAVGEKFGWKTFGEVPVLGTLTRNPKDFFIFTASALETRRVINDIVYAEGTTIEVRAANRRKAILPNMLKLTSSIGKMVLISCGRSYGRSPWFAVADAITQNASLVKFWWDRSAKRQARFTAVAA
ncbi:MAG: hypothetical protein H0V82_12035 [Candidatus Protochlamydia sp.]|nr:hypothetical protein [Candidatus Protochlamydia sp.]